MRDLTELNINEGGAAVRRPPPSDNAIANFERKFHVRLPENLLNLLRFANGGHPELDSFDPDGAKNSNDFGVDHFFHLTDDPDSNESLWREIQIWRPYIGLSALPFAVDGGGNVVFLELSEEPHTVKVCWHDENFRIGQMASSLEEFIDGLRENPEYI
jgi:hypothetical protein